MLGVLTTWILAYVVMGFALALITDDIKGWGRLIFIIWPIPVAIMILFIIYAIIRGLVIEIKDHIKK